MRHRIAPLILTLALATPAWSQDTEAPGILQRGFDSLWGQLFADDAPPAQVPAQPDAQGLAQDLSSGLAGALRRMGPVLQDLAAQIDDIRHYQAPERQPNGDILIRRREGAPPPPPLGENLSPAEDTAPGIAF